MALPSGYTPLEYIESTGSQYVDTGFKPNQDTRVVCDFEVLSTNTSESHVSSARTNGGTPLWTLYYDGSKYATRYGTGAVQTISSPAGSGRHVFDKNKNVLSIDGKTVNTVTYATFTVSSTLTIFCRNDGTAKNAYIKGRLQSYCLYDNGTLVRDYIPVQRLDGTVGLLDRANNVFYPDAAGGNFIAGPLAAKPEAPASLELIGTTRNAAILAWPGDPVVQNYRLYRDGVEVYEGSALCYTDAGLAAGSSYVYSVRAVIGSTESEGVTTEAATTEGIVLITDRTAADVSAGRRKGYYNAMDLIRVGEAMAYLEERFSAVGISVSVSPKLDWQLSDIPTHAQAHRYLTDIGVLRSKLAEFRDTVSLPGSMTALTWGCANDIEAILLDAEKLIQDIILSYRYYSGMAISGVNALP